MVSLHIESSEYWLLRREEETKEPQCFHASGPIHAGKSMTELKAEASFSVFSFSVLAFAGFKVMYSISLSRV